MNERLRFKEYLRTALSAAGPLAAIGIFLLSQGHNFPTWKTPANYVGWFLILLAVVVALWGLLSLFIPLLAGAFRQTLRLCWQVLVRISSFLLAIYSRLLGFLLRPVLPSTLHPRTNEAITHFDWKGRDWRLYPILQRADFRTVVQTGFRIRSVSFLIRPDYRHFHWRAGFRLGPINDDFEGTPIADTLLFSVSADRREGQPIVLVHWQNQIVQQGSLTAHGTPRPSFRVEANIWPTPDVGESGIEISVEGEVFHHRRIPTNCAERITFLAWADGREFTVYLDSVEIRWVPV